jgi:hypothetical protein
MTLMDNIGNFFSTHSVNPLTANAPAGTTAPVNGTPAPVYKSDSFTSTTNYSALSSGGMSFPISQIISEDPALASKFSKFFLSDSDRLLRVGTNWFGRFLVNMVAGNIPIFTSKTVSTQISNNVNLWIGRSDLVRAVGNPYYASLLQDVGIKNVNDLAIISNPSDQAVISQMMSAVSAQKGAPVYIAPATVAGWNATAQALPKYF